MLLRSASGKLVVSKEIPLCEIAMRDQDEGAADQLKRIEVEVQLLQSIKHPHVICYFNTYFSRDQNDVILIHIVMEFAGGGTLDETIQKQKHKGVHFETGQLTRWLSQLTSALQHIHAHRVLHRDLTS